jgi:hypothetical protein
MISYRTRLLAAAKEQARYTGASLTDVLHDPEMMATLASVVAAEAGTGGAATPIAGSALAIQTVRYAGRRSERLKKQGFRGNPGAKKGATKIQSLIFDRSMFSSTSAKEWAKTHGFKARSVDVQANTVRIRQFSPTSGTKGRWGTITLRPGVQGVVTVPKRTNPKGVTRRGSRVTATDGKWKLYRTTHGEEWWEYRLSPADEKALAKVSNGSFGRPRVNIPPTGEDMSTWHPSMRSISASGWKGNNLGTFASVVRAKSAAVADLTKSIAAGQQHARYQAAHPVRRALHDAGVWKINSKRKNGDRSVDVFGVTLKFDSNGNMTVYRGSRIDLDSADDYGSDPVFGPDGEPTGYVLLIPSGRVVTAKEGRQITTRKNPYRVAVRKPTTEELQQRAARGDKRAAGMLKIIEAESRMSAKRRRNSSTYGTRTPLRLIAKVEGSEVRVYKNADWDEYIVKPSAKAPERQWAHEATKADAIETAKAMATRKSNPKRKRAKLPSQMKGYKRTYKAPGALSLKKRRTLRPKRRKNSAEKRFRVVYEYYLGGGPQSTRKETHGSYATLATARRHARKLAQQYRVIDAEVFDGEKRVAYYKHKTR